MICFVTAYKNISKFLIGMLNIKKNILIEIEIEMFSAFPVYYIIPLMTKIILRRYDNAIPMMI